METLKIDNGYIHLGKTIYDCPHCKTQYNDNNDVLLERCNKNKRGYTKVECKKCENKFFVTFDYKGDIVSFK